MRLCHTEDAFAYQIQRTADTAGARATTTDTTELQCLYETTLSYFAEWRSTPSNALPADWPALFRRAVFMTFARAFLDRLLNADTETADTPAYVVGEIVSEVLAMAREDPSGNLPAIVVPMDLSSHGYNEAHAFIGNAYTLTRTRPGDAARLPRLLLLPFHANGHWTLAVYDSISDSYLHYDSMATMASAVPTSHQRLLGQAIARLRSTCAFVPIALPPGEGQRDAISCPLYVVAIARRILRGLSVTDGLALEVASQQRRVLLDRDGLALDVASQQRRVLLDRDPPGSRHVSPSSRFIPFAVVCEALRPLLLHDYQSLRSH
jgi:hypothetical protein